MHYYQFNIGDYTSHTNYLSLLEDLAYRRLLDAYYLAESPFPDDPKQVARKIGMRDNIGEVESVLSDFFDIENGFYHHKRVDEEIRLYHEKAVTARANGKKGGRPKKSKETQQEPTANPEETQPVNLANPEETGLKANHKPLTINHKPITKEDISSPNGSCPHSDIIDLYHSLLPELPAVKKSLWAGSNRERLLRARWRQSPQHQTLDFWSNLFSYVSKSDFLMGRNSANFRGCTLEWIVKPANFIKIIEGNYHGE